MFTRIQHIYCIVCLPVTADERLRAARGHVESAQAVGANLGNDRMPVASVAPGQTQFAVQVQGAARVLAVGSDRCDGRGGRSTAVPKKVTTLRLYNLSVRKPHPG